MQVATVSVVVSFENKQVVKRMAGDGDKMDRERGGWACMGAGNDENDGQVCIFVVCTH